MGLSLEIAMKQKQGLCLHQIQSLRILEMAGEELDSLLYQEFLENPLLECTRDNQKEERQSGTRYESFRVHSAGEIPWDLPAADQEDWRRELSEQIDFRRYTLAEGCAMQFMIEAVDEDGIYRLSLEESAKALGCPVELVERCHLILQGLEPFGVFSLSLEVYLIKQLKMLDLWNPHLEYMICCCLQDIARGNLKSISRALHIPVLEVKNAIEVIKELRPAPLNGSGNRQKEYLIPDVTLEKRGEKWELLLNEDWMRNYSISDYYLKMMEESQDETLIAYFHNQKRRYENLMDGIEQRRSTIQAIAQVILEYQEAYFLGAEEKKPMTMSDVAARSRMHVSTVSRAVKGKYLQAPRIGTVEMRSLFAAAPFRQDGKGMGADRVKLLIKELIDGEDIASPFSDSQIAQHLQRQDICVARRTVAKYREEMNIPNLTERKVS